MISEAPTRKPQQWVAPLASAATSGADVTELARLEGVVLDPVYTGKAFQGMVAEIEQGRFGDAQDIVFMHTGGIFGLFPQGDSFTW